MGKKFDVKKIRSDFPNLSVKIKGKTLVYLDNAATTLKPRSVIAAVNGYYKKYTSNVHRGVHTLSQKATEAYEGARAKVRDFIGAGDLSEIIFTKGTTESINLVAHSYGRKYLGEGDEIIISEMEHHSNIVPWQMLCEEKKCVLKIAPMNDAGEIKMEEFTKLLTPKTRFVSIVYVSNSLGTINPVEEIIKLARQRKAVVLVDAAQAVSHQRIDVKALDCDFLVFSGHKLFAPTGIGVLYGKHRHLDNMPPYQGGGDMIASVTFEKTVYNVLPYKFEAGTPNVAGAIGLGAAIDYLGTIDWSAMAAHKNDLLQYATQQLKKIPDLKLIGTAAKKASVVSFIHPVIHAHDMGTLVDEEAVAIRTGHHCTQPVMKHFGVAATSRASLAMYNTREEIDKLVKAIKRAEEVFK